MSASLLLVDDEPHVVRALQRALRPDGYQIHVAHSGSEALALVREHSPDLVITDQRMPGMSGSEFLIEMRRTHPEQVAIMLSGYADVQDIVSAINDGKIYQFLSKPWDTTVLRNVVRQALRLAEEARQNALLMSVQENMLDACLTLDPQGYVLTTNDTALRLLGFSKEVLQGTNISRLWSDRVNPDSLAAITHLLYQTGEWQGELWLRKADGEDLPIQLKMKVFFRDGRACGHTLYFRDHREAELLKQEIDTLRSHDETTGILNADAFMQAFQMRLGQHHAPEALLPVAVIRISKFEQLVVSLGYHVARRLLQEVGQRLLMLDRPEWLMGRLGEDRFAVATGWVEAASAVEELGSVLNHLFDEAFEYDVHCVPIRADIGIAVFPHDGGYAESLLQQAGMASERTSLLAEHGWLSFQECLAQQFGSRFLFECDLSRAIESSELSLCYQPQINLGTGQIESVEALVRWRHPTHGFIPPLVFVTHAEQSGLIRKLDAWVMQEAFTQLALWHRQGFDLHLSVNLSAVELESDEIIERCRKLIVDCQVSPHCIELEITETSKLELNTGMIHRIERLREMGFGIVLDDFGTGYSSLNALCTVPIDGIKIDRSFLYQSHENGRKRAVIESVMTLARELNLKLVAEGVDSDQQLEFLRREGLRVYAQSYMLGVPMSAMSIAVLMGGHAFALEQWEERSHDRE